MNKTASNPKVPASTAPTTGAVAKVPPAVLEQAVEVIRQYWSTTTQAMSAIGRVVLETCFAGNPHLLLNAAAQHNANYLALVTRLGTLGIGITPRVLGVAVRLAAYDHLVRGNHWKLLDAGRKEDLLPLRDPALMAEGARFAIEMGPTRANLQRWVVDRLDSALKPRSKKGVSMRGTQRACLLLAPLGEATTISRVDRDFQKATRAVQRRFLDHLRTARDHLTTTERRLARLTDA